MGTELQQTLGGWWRFNRYELVDGYIQRADDERMRLVGYSPWQDYRRSTAAQQLESQQPPYVSLLRLLDHIEPLPANHGRLQPQSEAAILKWCSEHGLLGTLFSLVQTVVLQPRLVKQAWASHGPVRCTFSRTGAGWRQDFVTRKGPVAVTDEHESQFNQGALVDSDDIDWQPHVIRYRSLRDTTLVREPLESTWAEHVVPYRSRHSRKALVYFAPAHDMFRWVYREPLRYFLEAAWTFRAMVEELSKCPERAPYAEASARAIPTWSAQTQQALLAPVRRTLAYVDRERQDVWVAPSLLSAYTAMFCEDWTARRPRKCEECGKVFISHQRDVKYHSARCRNTATKRKYRKGRREREAKAAQKAQRQERGR